MDQAGLDICWAVRHAPSHPYQLSKSFSHVPNSQGMGTNMLWNLKFKLAQHGLPEAMLTPPLRFSHQLKTKMTVLISHSTLNLSSSKEV